MATWEAPVSCFNCGEVCGEVSLDAAENQVDDVLVLCRRCAAALETLQIWRSDVAARGFVLENEADDYGCFWAWKAPDAN